MAVKVIIKRRVPKGKEAQILPLLLDLRAKATNQPGYISGETLINVNDPEDYITIGTWKTLENWKAWEGSKARLEVQNKIDELLREKATYRIYYYG